MKEGLNMEIKRGERFWCWWKSRYLWYKGQNAVTGKYHFEDAGDCHFYLDEKDVLALERI